MNEVLMLATIAPIFALLFSVAILLTGSGLLVTLLPVRAEMESFTTFQIGLMGSAYFFGFALSCLIAPFMIRRVGHIRSFTAVVCIAASAVLTHTLILKPAVWWILRAITGFCFAGLYMVIESWLSERSSNEKRGLIFSIYSIVCWVFISIGQLMITVSDPAAFTLFCLAGILISLAAVPVALTSAPAPEPIDTVKIRLIHLYRLSPVGMAGCAAYGLASGSFYALGPVFAKQSGLDIAGLAFFMSTTVLAGAIGQAPLGFISDRMDRRRIIFIACLAAAVAAIGMIFFNRLFGRSILIFAFLFGSFAFPLYSLSVAHANDRVSSQDLVETASGLLLVYGIGAVIGPLMASAFMTLIGERGLFSFTFLVHSAMAVFTLVMMRQRKPIPDANRTQFKEAAMAAQTLAPLEFGSPSPSKDIDPS